MWPYCGCRMIAVQNNRLYSTVSLATIYWAMDFDYKTTQYIYVLCRRHMQLSQPRVLCILLFSFEGVREPVLWVKENKYVVFNSFGFYETIKSWSFFGSIFTLSLFFSLIFLLFQSLLELVVFPIILLDFIAKIRL